MNNSIEESPSSYRNFGLVLLQTGISTFSTSIFDVLILWMAIALTNSPLITGIASSLLVVPLVFNFIVGAAIDNVENKRNLAVLASLLRTVAGLMLLFLLILPVMHLKEFALFLSAIVFGFTMDIFAPVRLVWTHKYLKKMVYLKGMSAINIVSRSARVTGYLCAGILIFFSLYLSILTVSILYFVSLIPILFLTEAKDRIAEKKDLSKSIMEGIGYIKESRVILQVIIVFVVAAFFMGMTDSTFTVLIKSVLNLQPYFLSFIFLSTSIGGIIGSAAAFRIKGNVGYKLTGLYSLSALLFFAVGAVSTIYVIMVMMLFVGILSGISSPILITLILRKAPRDKIGRIQGAMDTFGFSFNSFSGIFAGLVMSLVLPRYVFFIIAGGLFVLALIILRFKDLSETRV